MFLKELLNEKKVFKTETNFNFAINQNKEKMVNMEQNYFILPAYWFELLLVTLEIIIALILFIFPEINMVLLNLNNNNPLHTRLFASCFLSVNIIAIIFLIMYKKKQKFYGYLINDTTLHLLFFIWLLCGIVKYTFFVVSLLLVYFESISSFSSAIINKINNSGFWIIFGLSVFVWIIKFIILIYHFDQKQQIPSDNNNKKIGKKIYGTNLMELKRT